MARTDTLTNFLTDVASAIKTKKGDQTDILASNFDTEIANLPSGGGASEYFLSSISTATNPKATMYIKKLPALQLPSNATSLASTFSGLTSVEEVDVSNFTNTGITNMRAMFQNCNNLERIIGFENIGTSAVTDFSSTFNNCSSLTDINLSNLNTSSSTTFANMFAGCASIESIVSNAIVGGASGASIESMFSNCSSLKTLSLPNFNPSNPTSLSSFCGYCTSLETVNLPKVGSGPITTVRYMFRSCSKLREINMPLFNTTSTISSTNSQYIFGSGASLEKIDWRSFDWSKITPGTNTFQGVPDDCLIIVADATQKAWFNNGTYTSRFTNVKTVAEYESE